MIEVGTAELNSGEAPVVPGSSCEVEWFGAQRGGGLVVLRVLFAGSLLWRDGASLIKCGGVSGKG